MEKQYFYCYSRQMRMFLEEEKGLQPASELTTNPSTGGTYKMYEHSPELSAALTEHRNSKQRKDKKVFYCYSAKVRQFLEEQKRIQPVSPTKRNIAGRQYKEYERNSQLDEALEEYSQKQY